MSIVNFPKGERPSSEEWQRLVANAIEEIPRRMDLFAIMAQIAYKKYVTLQQNGFSKQQAFEIIKEDFKDYYK